MSDPREYSQFIYQIQISVMIYLQNCNAVIIKKTHINSCFLNQLKIEHVFLANQQTRISVLVLHLDMLLNCFFSLMNQATTTSERFNWIHSNISSDAGQSEKKTRLEDDEGDGVEEERLWNNRHKFTSESEQMRYTEMQVNSLYQQTVSPNTISPSHWLQDSATFNQRFKKSLWFASFFDWNGLTTAEVKGQ